MRRLFKQAVSLFLVPATRWYLRKERSYTFEGIKVKIPPTVFHPGLFPSTRFLIAYLKNQDIVGQSFLELGCGSGLISIWALKQKANVFACDLNSKAVQACVENAKKNSADIKVIHSNLFDSLPKIKFDWMVINPPYYSKKIANDEELAWNCGENFEFFQKLFSSLADYTHENSKVIMVLTQGCNIDSIKKIASANHFEFILKAEQSVLFDGLDFIFEIKRTNN
ncbi:MAG TPA: methyltransferase [Cytophagales bacterium]|jgi:release factor glutamine methyltransferase|nr:methyltransferase [Cytophagales bacterium]